MDAEIVKLNAQVAALQLALVALLQALPEWQRAGTCGVITRFATSASPYNAEMRDFTVDEERTHQMQVFLKQMVGMVSKP
jgi:hypothetical protein